MGEWGGREAETAGEGAELNSPEITEFDRPILPQQNILWLHVSVDHTMRVEVVQRRHQLPAHCLHLTHTHTHTHSLGKQTFIQVGVVILTVH